MFIHIKSGNPARHSYIAATEITELCGSAERAILRDGRVVTLVNPSDAERLLADTGIVRGIELETGKAVAVPVGSIDNVIDDQPDGSAEWVAVATTLSGVRFIVSCQSRARLGLDDEFFDFADLMEQRAILRGEVAAVDADAEAAVAAAEAGRVRKAG